MNAELYGIEMHILHFLGIINRVILTQPLFEAIVALMLAGEQNISKYRKDVDTWQFLTIP